MAKYYETQIISGTYFRFHNGVVTKKEFTALAKDVTVTVYLNIIFYHRSFMLKRESEKYL